MYYLFHVGMRSKYLKKQNKYNNPYFKKKKKRVASKINWRLQFFIFETLILIVGLIWFFNFSTVFQIVSASTSGTTRIEKNELIDIVFEQTKESRFLLGGQENIFFFNLKELEDALHNRYLLTDLVIKKELPNKIVIDLVEKDYSAIWQEADQYYYISETGKIINKAGIKDKERYPLINNIGANFIDSQGARDEAERIDYIIQLSRKLQDKKIRLIKDDKWFRVENFILDNMEYTVQMVIEICNNVILEKPIIATMLPGFEGPQQETVIDFEIKEECNEGPMIYFNLQEDVEKQISKLLVIINEKLKNNLDEQEYIDLRYGDKVYYK